jgi:hypothetical protein
MLLGLKTERYPADWKKHGRKAGPLRNEHMASLGADLALGFRCAGKSNGTDHMARMCEKYDIPLERYGEGWL